MIGIRSKIKSFLRIIRNRLGDFLGYTNIINAYKAEQAHLKENIERLMYGPAVDEYDTYELASSHCQTLDAYENEQLVKYMRAKNDIFVPRISDPSQVSVDSASLTACAIFQKLYFSLNRRPMKVIDFGGAFGNLLYYFDLMLGEKAQVDWRVVETPNMVKHSAELESERLSFYDSIDKAAKGMGQTDLLYTSGALQYTGDPTGMLHRLTELRAEYMFFNRSAFSLEDKEIVSIQKSRLKDNGPQIPMPEFAEIEEVTIEYPICYMTKKDFDKQIQNKYELVLSISEISGVHSINRRKVFGNAELYQLRNN